RVRPGSARQRVAAALVDRLIHHGDVYHLRGGELLDAGQAEDRSDGRDTSRRAARREFQRILTSLTLTGRELMAYFQRERLRIRGTWTRRIYNLRVDGDALQ